MENIIEQATIAQAQGNLSLVTHFLQQLPLEKNNHNLPSFDEVVWEQILSLSLFVLKNSDFQQRWDIAKVFPKLGKPAIPSLLTIWENEETEVELRWFVGRILGEFNYPQVILSLIKVIQESEEEQLLKVATESLGNIGEKAIVSLIALLKEDDETRLLAIKALAQIRRPDSIKPLLSVIKDSNPMIRALAIEALGSFHNQEITATLINSLQDKAAIVRKEAVISLGFRHQKELKSDMVNHLKPLLYDLNLEVCQQTALTLGRIGTQEAIAELFVVLKSRATPVLLQIPIVRALGWCENKIAVKYLGLALSWVEVNVCEEIISILGKQSNNEVKKQANEILIRFLSGKYQANQKTIIKQKIAIALGELSQTEGRHFLELLSQDREKTVQLHAAYGLKKYNKTKSYK